MACYETLLPKKVAAGSRRAVVGCVETVGDGRGGRNGLADDELVTS
jgi:hypothetical protein